MGEHRHALDEKGRLFIPARFREELGVRFVVTKGLDHCLFAYAPGEWRRLEQVLRTLPFTRADARAFLRFFFAGAAEVEPDRQGRISLPPQLRDHARLRREAVILGVGERVEIWAAEEWEAYSAKSAAAVEAIAEKLTGLPLGPEGASP